MNQTRGAIKAAKIVVLAPALSACLLPEFSAVAIVGERTVVYLAKATNRQTPICVAGRCKFANKQLGGRRVSRNSRPLDL